MAAKDRVDLDETDCAIIRQLQEDGRRTYGRIAKAVGLSEPATRQRVGRLIKDDAIHIVAIVNPRALGYRLRVAVGIECGGELESALARLIGMDEIVWLVATAGSFDLVAEIRCRDEHHLYDLLSNHIRKVPGVRRAATFTYFEVFKAQYPWPPGSGRRSPPRSRAAAGSRRRSGSDETRPPVVLDDLDRGIIRELQDDGRRSYGRIAKAVGLSEPPTRQRVGRLIREDVIQIVAIINPRIAEYRLRATIGVVCEGDLRAAAAALADIDEIENLVGTVGDFDFLAEVRCEDEQHLYTLLANGLRQVPGVRRTESFVHLNITKERYPWPPGFAVRRSKSSR